MKVILIKDVADLGVLGDKKEVKDGFARNFLIPNKFAIEATDGALRILEKKKQEKQRKEEQLKKEYEQIAGKLKDISCTISMDAGEEDKLFGSVTSEMIAEHLRAESGAEIDKKQVVLEDPIKALGVYNVEIRLHPEVRTEVRVWVVKK